MAVSSPISPSISLLPSSSRRRLPPIFSSSSSAAAASISYARPVLGTIWIRNGGIKVTPLKSVRIDRLLTSDEEGAMGDGFFEAIEELERMERDPSDVLGDMVDRLSSRELQLVLVYFSQEGRDSYCALEVFDWLKKENRVDGETMELMVSIVCGWIGKLIEEDCAVEQVVGLLDEMECVGLEPGFSMMEKVVSLYWDRGKKGEAVEFVKYVMGRGGIGGTEIGDGGGVDGKGGPVGYLAWKMMVDGNYLHAVKMVIEFKECGLKPEVYSYLIAMTALVKEQKEFSKSLRKLRGSIKAGSIADLDEESLGHIEEYQSDLLRNGTRLSDWALQEGGSKVSGVVHERLLALYTCAGFGLEAEHQLWEMKLCGKEPDRELYDIVLAICASQNEVGAVRRLLAGMDAVSAGRRKKTLIWLLRGYIKGGYYTNASETLMEMLDRGLYPDYLDRAAVLQGLRKSIQETRNAEPYLKLCKRLSDLDLIGPCLVYLHINKHKLWIVKTL